MEPGVIFLCLFGTVIVGIYIALVIRHIWINRHRLEQESIEYEAPTPEEPDDEQTRAYRPSLEVTEEQSELQVPIPTALVAVRVFKEMGIGSSRAVEEFEPPCFCKIVKQTEKEKPKPCSSKKTEDTRMCSKKKPREY